MKILIISYFFYPDINARSFRATELAKEFSRTGHSVTVLTKEPARLEGIEIIAPLKKDTFFNKLFNKKTLSFAWDVVATLKRRSEFDLILSIGLPISTHLGTYFYRIINADKTVTTVADYGDPFYPTFEGTKKTIVKYLEKCILQKFDFITVPIQEALPIYRELKPAEFIKVIPQGIDYKNIQISTAPDNTTVTFAYAGIFYEHLRNPKVLLDYLAHKDEDFRFIIYTDLGNPQNMSLLNPYREVLRHKLILHDLVKREQCIFELSKADFLIYQENTTSGQKSSKIIDYLITRRPIFTFDQDHFSSQEFELFFHKQDHTDITSYTDTLKTYDIAHIAQEFLTLASSIKYPEEKA